MQNIEKYKSLRVFKRCPKPKFKLFCFPFAGGSASFYREWANFFDAYGVEVCAIQLPGHEDRIFERLLVDIHELVFEIVEDMKGFQDIPFAFFGHSLGALVGFEVAQKMKKLNMREPVLLFVSSGRAPHIRPRRIIHHLSDEDFLLKVRELGGIPDLIIENKEFAKLFVPIIKADFSIIENYCFRDSSPLNYRIIGYSGKDDVEVSYEEIAAWKIHSLVPFKMKIYEGDHFYLKNRKNLLLENVLDHIMSNLNTETVQQ